MSAKKSRPVQASRNFSAAQLGRLTYSWETDPGAINRVLRFQLRTLRARSRQLVRSDGYAAKFINLVAANVGGPDPFRLEAKIRRPRGTLDSRANRLLENAWRTWAYTPECDAAGRLSLPAMIRSHLRTVARDGEGIIRLRLGEGAHGLRLQMLDIDRLDEERNDDLRDAGAIKMGVQVDSVGRPVYYHLLTQHPGEYGFWGGNQPKTYIIVPAELIIHFFLTDTPEQVRGVPLISPVMFRLWNLSGFEEASVINARVGASKMGFYTSPDGLPPKTVVNSSSDNAFVQTAEPGAFETLPVGYDLKSWNPQFPDASVEPFTRQSLRGIASGLNVAYHSLANDPSDVNYSTARVFRLDDIDSWMAVQTDYVHQVMRRIFDAWRFMAVLKGILPNEAMGERYASVHFQPKTWSSVDPLKDIQAAVLALKASLTSRTRLASEDGRDIEDILEEIAEETALAQEMGVPLDLPNTTGANSPVTEESPSAKAPQRKLRAID
jgi:lambda family phage portal protein